MNRIPPALVVLVLVVLAPGHGLALAAEGAGSLRIETDPGDAAVYVDGRFAGRTPLTMAAVAPGVHRVRLSRDGYLDNSRMVTVKAGVRATFQARLTQTAPPLKIVVLEGEGAVNIIQQKTAVAPVIEVRDRNDQPISGAVVRFAIQKGRASFGGTRTLTVTTDALGRATAAGLTPTGSGALQIGAAAAFQGQTAAIAIAQTNVLTAAEAATAASTGTAAASAGGGGFSHVALLGIAGGAGAGGLIAWKALSKSGVSNASSDFDACRASAVCGIWDVLFNPPLDVSACSTAVQGGFPSQTVGVDLNGAFHEIWSPLTPIVMVDGTLTPTGFNATLRCVTTPATGAMSASPSGPGMYAGSATLAGKTFAVTVAKKPG